MQSRGLASLVDEQLRRAKCQRLDAEVEIFFNSSRERFLIDQQELAAAVLSWVLLDPRIAIVEQ